jgi:peptide/nickel transport system substrate-binding protein
MTRGDGPDTNEGAIWLPDSFNRRNFVRSAVGVSLGASALVAAACGDSGSGAKSGSDTSGSPASGTAKTGGVLKFAITDATTSEKLDPSLSFTTNDAVYCGAIFEGLTTYDNDFKALPVLATSWTPNDEATEWTFKLRPDVKWHDGTPFTSKDVVFSIKRLLDKNLGSAITSRLAPSIAPSGVSAPDDATVVIKLKKPDSLIPVALGSRNAKMVKDGTTKFTVETAIGTGPFKLDSWTAGRQWKVSRNPDYWQKSLPYLDGVTATIISDGSTKLQSVVTGQNDLTDAIDLSSVATVQGNPSLSLLQINDRVAWVFSMDSTQKPYTDERVGRAIKIGQDRQKISDTVFAGLGRLTGDVPVGPKTPYYPDGLVTEPQIDEAKSLLAQAGYSNGLDIQLNTSAVAAGMVDIATAWKDVLKPIGVNVTLKQWPTSAYWNKAWMQTSAFQDYWNMRHPAEMLAFFYRKGAVWNEVRYSSDDLDKLIDGVFETTDPDEQASKIQDAYALTAEKVPYAIPVLSPQVWAQKKTVKGVQLDPVDYVTFLKASLA